MFFSAARLHRFFSRAPSKMVPPCPRPSRPKPGAVSSIVDCCCPRQPCWLGRKSWRPIPWSGFSPRPTTVAIAIVRSPARATAAPRCVNCRSMPLVGGQRLASNLATTTRLCRIRRTRAPARACRTPTARNTPASKRLFFQYYAMTCAEGAWLRLRVAFACGGSPSSLAKISGISKIARLSSPATFLRNSASVAGSSICRTPAATS